MTVFSPMMAEFEGNANPNEVKFAGFFIPIYDKTTPSDFRKIYCPVKIITLNKKTLKIQKDVENEN